MNLAARVLKEAGCESSRFEAELLLRYVTGLDRADLFTALDSPAPAGLDEAYGEAVDLRAEGCPTAYITGEREFWSLPIIVSPQVLIPRPETEVAVEVALGLLGPAAPEGAPVGTRRVLDVGTGSGCIACALVSERPELRVTATDRSADALLVAAENAFELDLEDRIDLVCCDLYQGLAPADGGAVFELVVSNPPYVADGAALPREVADYEPAAALYAGPTGLEAYDAILAGLPRVLAAGGALVLEVGMGQAAEVLRRVERAGAAAGGGWKDLGVTQDLAGIPRVVWAAGWRNKHG